MSGPQMGLKLSQLWLQCKPCPMQAPPWLHTGLPRVLQETDKKPGVGEVKGVGVGAGRLKKWRDFPGGRLQPDHEGTRVGEEVCDQEAAPGKRPSVCRGAPPCDLEAPLRLWIERRETGRPSQGESEGGARRREKSATGGAPSSRRRSMT